MNRAWMAFAASAIFATPSVAQTPDEARTALNNLQHEMSTCVAYYTTTQACVRLRDETDPLDKVMGEHAEVMLMLAMQIGDSIGMTTDAMMSRVKIESSSMQSLMRNDCVNFSSILERYALRCKHLIENPEEILSEYVNRARDEH